MKVGGLTKPEVAIVFTIIALVTFIFVRGCLRAGFATDEVGAISSLMTIASAEDTFRSQCLKDRDGDGIGEYGTLAELAGLQPPAGETYPVDPPLIDTELGGGTKYHYTFEAFPGEPDPDGTPGIDAQEQRFLAAAWPVKGSRSWRFHRSFIVDQSRKVYGGNTDGEKPQVSSIWGRPP